MLHGMNKSKAYLGASKRFYTFAKLFCRYLSYQPSFIKYYTFHINLI